MIWWAWFHCCSDLGTLEAQESCCCTQLGYTWLRLCASLLPNILLSLPPFMKGRKDTRTACVHPLQGKLFCNLPHVHIPHGSPCQGGVINKRIKEVLVFSASLSIDSRLQPKADNIYREQSCICGGHMVRDLAGDAPKACLKLNPKLSGWLNEREPRRRGVMVIDTEETILFSNRLNWSDKLKQTGPEPLSWWRGENLPSFTSALK